ncbi:MAG: M48 family metallopeptidase [Neisseriaceae bacterium]|nr:M48 family metallopeptidase [Neisseriaceae bacterium]
MSLTKADFTHDFNGQLLPVKVSHRAKTRIYLRLRQHTLHISAPKHVSTAQLRAFLDSHQAFIARSLSAVKPLPTALPESLYYLGQPLALVWRSASDTGASRIDPDQGCIWLSHALRAQPLATQKKAVRQLYLASAQATLPAQLQRISQDLPKQPHKIRLSNARGTWGTCKSDGTIGLNWRLMGAPAAVIHYVCVHELCHLVHLNHSPAFWQLVATYAPNVKAAKAWLKQHQQALFCLDD